MYVIYARNILSIHAAMPSQISSQASHYGRCRLCYSILDAKYAASLNFLGLDDCYLIPRSLISRKILYSRYFLP